MITLFSCPKVFKGVTAIHQYNAIQSWKALEPGVQVILVGDEEGTAEASRDLGVTHAPECARNEHGTPLIDSIFGQARAHTHHRFLCYVNADIILTRRFISCFLIARAASPRFLLVGKRWDVDWDAKLDFQQPLWEQNLLAYVRGHGRRASQWQIDYFAFPESEFQDLPPFAVGRIRWDNWMIWKAVTNRIPAIDASSFITAIHQNHDYGHHPQGQKGVWEGVEATRNHELAGGWLQIYSISDTTYKIIGFTDHRRPCLLICRFPRIAAPVTRWWHHSRMTLPFRHLGNVVRLVFQGQWRLVWAKLVKKLNAWRDRGDLKP